MDALNITEKSRNLTFLDGKNILPDKVKIQNLEILFNKVNP